MLQGLPSLQNMMLALIRPMGERLGETLSLAEQIALQVASDIVEERLAPLDRITEVTLAERFQVSRGPVREALLMLDSSGLVRLLPRRGAIVTGLSEQEVADLFEIRAVLFGLAARRLALSHDAQTLDELGRRLAVLQAIAPRQDPKAGPDYAMAVLEAGNYICVASGVEQLTAMVARLFFRTLRYSRLGLARIERRGESCANWARLVEQIGAGDGEGAEATARQLVSQSCAEAIRQLGEAA